MDTLRTQFLRPVVQAGVGGVMLDYQLPGNSFQIADSVPVIGGRTYSTMAVGAALGFSSSFITEALNNIFTAVDQKNRLKSFPSFATHVGGAIGSWVVLPMLVGDIDGQSAKTLAVGGLATEVIGQWIYENFVVEGSFGQDVLDLI